MVSASMAGVHSVHEMARSPHPWLVRTVSIRLHGLRVHGWCAQWQVLCAPSCGFYNVTLTLLIGAKIKLDKSMKLACLSMLELFAFFLFVNSLLRITNFSIRISLS